LLISRLVFIVIASKPPRRVGVYYEQKRELACSIPIPTRRLAISIGIEIGIGIGIGIEIGPNSERLKKQMISYLAENMRVKICVS